MEKIKLGIIFGGTSTEHEVSVKSAKSIIDNLNKEKYDINKVFINKQGEWIDKNSNKQIANIFSYLKKLDVVFPILHGKYGEDGTIQGLFEMLNIPYVGTGVLASANGMDKVYAKIIFEKANISQAKYVYIKHSNDKYIYITNSFEEINGDLESISKNIIKYIKLPVFVKPSNSGSSVGIKKATTIQELIDAIKYASRFDSKILVEEEIVGREIECAVLGNSDVKASRIGEILSADVFYSYEAKYEDANSKTKVPVDIAPEKEDEIRNLAIKAYKALDCTGLSRVDFFVEKGTEKVYINEINTMPGFTKISMYPKLWEYTGLKYSDLLDELINLALKR